LFISFISVLSHAPCVSSPHVCHLGSRRSTQRCLQLAFLRSCLCVSCHVASVLRGMGGEMDHAIAIAVAVFDIPCRHLHQLCMDLIFRWLFLMSRSLDRHPTPHRCDICHCGYCQFYMCSSSIPCRACFHWRSGRHRHHHCGHVLRRLHQPPLRHSVCHHENLATSPVQWCTPVHEFTFWCDAEECEEWCDATQCDTEDEAELTVWQDALQFDITCENKIKIEQDVRVAFVATARLLDQMGVSRDSA